jgi:hypothetical protein
MRRGEILKLRWDQVDWTENLIRLERKQAMRISGHKSRSIFDRYDMTDERDIKIAGQKPARYLEQKTEIEQKGPGAVKPEKQTAGERSRALQ